MRRPPLVFPEPRVLERGSGRADSAGSTVLGEHDSVRFQAQAQALSTFGLVGREAGDLLHAGQAVTSFVTYDKRLLEAAAAAGLPVVSPA